MSICPTVSVIIPAYNAAAYLPETLQSVFAQTYTAHEIIVVNDGSTDETEEILESYSDRIIHVKQKNLGEGAARNAGLERATGKWVAFLDADDVWQPTKLERQVALLTSRSDLVCVHTWFYLFGDRNEVLPIPSEVLQEQYDMEVLIGHALVLPSSAVVRRDVPVRFQLWPVISIDMIYFAELSREGRFACVQEPLVGYRKHAHAMTRQVGNLIHSVECRLRWIEEGKGLDVEVRERLKRRLFLSVVRQTEGARWARDWPRYWTLREYLARAWPWPKTGLPTVTTERIYPRIVYRLKDAFDSLIDRRHVRHNVRP